MLSYVHRHLRLPFTRMGTAVDNVRARRQIEAVGAYEAVHGVRRLPNGGTVQVVWHDEA